MKSIRYQFHRFFTTDTLFYSYRWAAWSIAAAVVMVRHSLSEPLHIWLLILTFVLNIVFTAFSQPYIRVVHRRQFLLILDILASVALVWVSGGSALPFLPYALGSLVLPGLLFGWRVALGMSLMFVVPDSITFLGTRMDEDRPLLHLVVRAAAPPMFALVWLWVPWLAQRLMLLPIRAFPQRSTEAAAYAGEQLPPGPDANTFQGYPSFREEAEPSARPAIPERSVAAQLTTIRATTQKSNQEPARSVYSITSNPEIEFHVALKQVIYDFTSQNDIDIRMTQIGPVQQLTPVQYSTLLKLAYEALLNIRQHAHAHSVQLTLEYAPQSIRLTVEDDGVGLLDGTYKRPGVHALRAVHYRLAELDGYLEVFEGEKGGVVVRGTLPLDT